LPAVTEIASTTLSPRDSAIAHPESGAPLRRKGPAHAAADAQGHRSRSFGCDFQSIATILYYLVAFPERCHHPKEDKYLFKHLRARNRQSQRNPRRARSPTREERALIASLERAFVLYQGGAPGGFRGFAKAVGAMRELQWKHMELEESRMFELAHKYLFGVDWFAIDRVFRANDDPLFGAVSA
jgi:hemerythrin-like domain-containing protein